MNRFIEAFVRYPRMAVVVSLATMFATSLAILTLLAGIELSKAVPALLAMMVVLVIRLVLTPDGR